MVNIPEFDGKQELQQWIKNARFELALENIDEAAKVTMLQFRVSERFRWGDGQTLPVSTAIPGAQQGQPINTFQRLFLWLKSILIPHADAHEEAAKVQLNKITFSRMDDPFKFRDKVTRLLGIAGYHQDRKAAQKVI